MNKFLFSIAFVFCMTGACFAVDLVKDGKPVAEIVIAESAEPSVRTAADELQDKLEKMSGARLAIVSTASPEVKNQVYVGESEYTRKLGVKLDDVKYDGFKIVADKNYVVVAGKEIDFLNVKASFAKYRDAGRQRQKM
ncbi:MAG: alpha-glucuronidase family glycosyl hydrolase, partial [Lentisphaerota bacterium]